MSARQERLQAWLPECEEIALKHFRRSDLASENKAKSGFDPVTIADQKIETCLRQHIEAEFPNDGIIGEEFENKHGISGVDWVLDPIDGTRAFVIGSPSFCTLVAIRSQDEKSAAVISQPYLKERFWGVSNNAFLEHGGKLKRIMVSECREIPSARLATTFPEIGTHSERLQFDNVAQGAKLVRYGLDAYGYALLALGHLDLVIEAGLNPYDYSAPQIVVEAAGGVFTDWQGNPPQGQSTVIAAATPELHQEALALLNA